MKRSKRSKRLAILGVALAIAVLVPLAFVAPALAYGPGGFGGGMMGGYGGGMMGGWGGSSGMPCGGWGGYGGYPGTSSTGEPISMDQAVTAFENYVKAYGNPDLAVTEVMEFQYNYYAMVQEKSTGVFAFELLADRFGGGVGPEMGPNMMWNTKYGHMGGWGRGGMMGGWWNGQNQQVTPSTPMTVTPEQAKEAAQRYLDAYYPGSTTEEPDAFYGYYTLHTMKDGKETGMLSVNGYTGSVWYHSWHGDFVQERDLD